MRRLTFFNGDYIPCVSEDSCMEEQSGFYCGAAIDRLAAYENAEEDGRLVMLPCKDWLDIVFGEQVLFYGIDKDYFEEPIREITVDNAERIGWYDGYKTVFLKGTDENGEAWEFYPEEIGKTVFLTREEAERMLKVQNVN